MRRDQIREAVSIEVTHDQWNRIVPWPEVLSDLKRAVSAAKQNRKIMRASISYCEIREAVAVEIGNHNRLRAHSGGDVGSCTKSAVTVSEQDRYRTRSEEHRTDIRHGQVPQTVAVEIGHRDRHRLPSDREGMRRGEGPLPAPQPNGECTRRFRIGPRQ